MITLKKGFDVWLYETNSPDSIVKIVSSKDINFNDDELIYTKSMSGDDAYVYKFNKPVKFIIGENLEINVVRYGFWKNNLQRI
jgi:hypothetical protein